MQTAVQTIAPPTLESLRRYASRAREFVAPLRGDRPSFPAELRPAAVLILLVQRPEGLSIVLTERHAGLREHAGQISFPGGRLDGADSSAIEAALREAEEEIGVPRTLPEVLFCLPQYVTASNYAVVPVVAALTSAPELAMSTSEVASAFDLPFGVILDARNHQRNYVVSDGVARNYYAIPFGHRYIWGATAAMLLNLHAFVSAAQSRDATGVTTRS